MREMASTFLFSCTQRPPPLTAAQTPPKDLVLILTIEELTTERFAEIRKDLNMILAVFDLYQKSDELKDSHVKGLLGMGISKEQYYKNDEVTGYEPRWFIAGRYCTTAETKAFITLMKAYLEED